MDNTYIENGNIPIILISSHNGQKHLDIAVRKVKNSILRNDLNINYMCKLVSKNIEKELSYKPYIILNNIHRKYIDLNRTLSEGVESDKAKKIWLDFHTIIEDTINKCKNIHGHCLLFDLHGNKRTTNLLELGYGISIDDIDQKKCHNSSLRFLNKFYNPNEIILGKNCFANFTTIETVPSSKYYKKNDILKFHLGENKFYYSGGYITTNYSDKFNIDTIQLEISSNLRSLGNIHNTANDISNSIIMFYYNNYYPILKMLK